jgi:hypothetical protein
MRYDLDLCKSVHLNFVSCFSSNAMFHCLVNTRLQILAKLDKETSFVLSSECGTV